MNKKKEYKKPSWAVEQIVRMDGRVEDICCHGVGHINAKWLKEHDTDGKKKLGVHCCDGCCSKEDDEE